MSFLCASKPRIATYVALCFALLLAAGLPEKAHAQVLYGSIVGTVTDQSGAVLPGAQITVTNEGTGLTREAVSDSGGSYRILELPGGSYTLSATAKGFKALKKTNIPVVIGQGNQQDLQLEVGAVTQEVTVQASAAVLQTTKADVHTTVSSYVVENIPVDFYRNFQSVELLAPGVFADSQISRNYPNSAADTPDRSLNIDSNGLPPRINTTRVDGATNLFVWLPNHMLIVPPIETIQEVNVQTASFDVEKGLTAGAATDVVTKSGTNEIHGTLYGFHTDQALDARNLFFTDRVSPKKPKHIVNNDGAAVGGPIKKNKLFYFANWDLLSERTNASGFDTIPPSANSATSDWRHGDFSSALGLPLFDSSGNPIMVTTTEGATVQLQQGMVFDPATGNQTTATGRSVFSSGGKLNVIPGSRINQGALNFWNLLPAPNYFPLGPAFSSKTPSNYFFSKSQSFTRNIFTGKIDWDRSVNHRIWGTYMGQKFNYDDATELGPAGGGGTGPNHQYAQTTTLGHTWTMSANKVLTGHLGFTRMSEVGTPPGFGKPLGQTLLGIPGTNEPVSDVRYSGLPGISISGFSAMGSPTSWEPVYRNDWTLTSSHNLTWIRGKHEFRVGFDTSHNHLNHWQPEIVCCPRGSIYFTQDNTGMNLPADPTNPGGAQLPVFTKTGGTLTAAGTGFSTDRQNSVAVFDLGYLTEVLKSEQFIRNTAKDTQWGIYFGDRWKVTPKFTADLGVRYEYFPIITRDGAVKFELYDPTTNVLSLGGLGGNSTHLGVSSSRKLFSPRIGLAYVFNDKTVVRTGFGISNDTLPLERTLRGFYPLAIGADDFVPSSNFSGWFPFTTFAQGIPRIQDPNISSGKITPPLDVIVGTLAPGHFNRGYVESWNFFIERRLPGEFLLNVGYVGNHFVHELNGRNLNAAPLGTRAAGQPLFAQFGRTGESYAFAGYLDSHYNSLQVSLYRHAYKGLFIQGSYTYSKAIDYENDNSWENSLSFSCPPSAALPQGCQPHNRRTAGFDHTHMLKMAYVYELPLGQGRKWANSNPAARAVLGGWQINGYFNAWNGVPLNPGFSASRLRTPGSSQTPDQIGPVRMTKGHGPGEYWFDITSFAPVLDFARFGSVGRGLSWLRGPGLIQMDAALQRNFRIKERWELQARVEAQNLTNTPHFRPPGGYGSGSVAGTTNCANINGVCGGSFGQITSAYGERFIQIGAKIKF